MGGSLVSASKSRRIYPGRIASSLASCIDSK
jgi:hypothetical protein